jgi:hypothetical protein
MALVKPKPASENHLEELAERVASDINERAAEMSPQKRARADAETRKIADRVRRRTLQE